VAKGRKFLGEFQGNSLVAERLAGMERGSISYSVAKLKVSAKQVQCSGKIFGGIRHEEVNIVLGFKAFCAKTSG
jgi:hypothetical protein